MHNKGNLVEDSLYALKNPKKTKFECLLKKPTVAPAPRLALLPVKFAIDHESR